MYKYVYCITNVLNKEIPNVAGIGNAPLQAVQYNHEIAAIVSEVAAAQISVSAENILRHAAVIDAIQKTGTVLPARFHSVLSDDSGVMDFLKQRYTVFISDLKRLLDTQEMGIRVFNKKRDSQINQGKEVSEKEQGKQSGIFHTQYQSSNNKPKQSVLNPGTAYLEQRRMYYSNKDEDNTWAFEIQRFCCAHFEGVYRDCKMEKHSPFFQCVSLHFLIHKNCLPEFTARFHDAMACFKEFHFACSGPWPPYHFVS